MAKIVLIKEEQLVKGGSKEPVYPITSAKAVYLSNKKHLLAVLNENEALFEKAVYHDLKETTDLSKELVKDDFYVNNDEFALRENIGVGRVLNLSNNVKNTLELVTTNKLNINDLTTKVLKEVYIEYTTTTSATTKPTESAVWTKTAPTRQTGIYIWLRTVTVNYKNVKEYSDPICVSDSTGKEIELYTWVKYADSALGKNMIDNPYDSLGNLKKYIGFAYNKTTPNESDNPNDYYFVLVDVKDGVPGDPGATYYTWIKYAKELDVTEGEFKYPSVMLEYPTKETYYIGIAVNKDTETEGDNPKDYVWSLWRGNDGVLGNACVILGTLVNKVNLPTVSAKLGDSYIINGDLWCYTCTIILDDTHYRGFTNSGKIAGDKGDSLSKVQTLYYWSTSNTELKEGAWKYDLDYVEGKFLWTRLELTYSNSLGEVVKTEYSTPALDDVVNKFGTKLAYVGTDGIYAGTIAGDKIIGNSISADKIKTSELVVGKNIDFDPKVVLRWTPLIVDGYWEVNGNRVGKAIGEDGANGTSVNIKGSKSSVDLLPTTGNKAGDGYLVQGILYIWGLSDDEETYTWILAGAIQGPSGNSITLKNLEIKYASADELNHSFDPSDWKDNIEDTDVTKKYLYTKTITTYENSNGSADKVVETLVISVRGANGSNLTVKSTEVAYALSSYHTLADVNNIPESDWDTTKIPELVAGKYLWTRTKVTYSTDDVVTSYSISYISKDGLAALLIRSSLLYYAIASSSDPTATEIATKVWSPVLSYSKDKYLWERLITTYNDGKDYELVKQGSSSKLEFTLTSSCYLFVESTCSTDWTLTDSNANSILGTNNIPLTGNKTLLKAVKFNAGTYTFTHTGGDNVKIYKYEGTLDISEPSLNEYVNLVGTKMTYIGNDGLYSGTIAADDVYINDSLKVGDAFSVSGDNIVLGDKVSLTFALISDGDSITEDIESLQEDLGNKATWVPTYITKDLIQSMNLKVGNEILMGENATISWSNVNGRDLIEQLINTAYEEANEAKSRTDVLNDTYLTTISRDAITTEFIKSKQLEVGKEIKMGSNAIISWDNLTEDTKTKLDTRINNYMVKHGYNPEGGESGVQAWLDSLALYNVTTGEKTKEGTELNTYIDANNLVSRQVTANTVLAGKISASNITAGKIESKSTSDPTKYIAIDTLTDLNYLLWAGNEDATNAPFSVTKKGELKANSGTIAGWTINNSEINSRKFSSGFSVSSKISPTEGFITSITPPTVTNPTTSIILMSSNFDNWGFISDDYTIKSGIGGYYKQIIGGETTYDSKWFISLDGSGYLASGNLKWDEDGGLLLGEHASIDADTGNLKATDVDLTGKITATSGTIGNWSIGNGIFSTKKVNNDSFSTLIDVNRGFKVSRTTNSVTSSIQMLAYPGSAICDPYDDLIPIGIGGGVENQLNYNWFINVDGYGYFAKGNLKWDNEGNLYIGRYTENSETKYKTTIGTDGKLKTKDAEIEGKITANDGTIGGWKISDDNIHRLTILAGLVKGTTYISDDIILKVAYPSGDILSSTLIISPTDGIRCSVEQNGSNTSKLAFNPNGSGYLATDSIVWDELGNVEFNNKVDLTYLQDITILGKTALDIIVYKEKLKNLAKNYSFALVISIYTDTIIGGNTFVLKFIDKTQRYASISEFLNTFSLTNESVDLYNSTDLEIAKALYPKYARNYHTHFDLNELTEAIGAVGISFGDSEWKTLIDGEYKPIASIDVEGNSSFANGNLTCNKSGEINLTKTTFNKGKEREAQWLFRLTRPTKITIYSNLNVSTKWGIMLSGNTIIDGNSNPLKNYVPQSYVLEAGNYFLNNGTYDATSLSTKPIIVIKEYEIQLS